ncbi:MAG: sigma 54-interacting transcriptional regulator [Planctomycetes bacterium]|nr:sigma 54-interacting transcriptional regulator [Planctomycetota bacterium]
MPRLVIIDGPDKGTIFEISGDTTIGRSSDNPIRLNHSQVSRVHARIIRRGDDFYVRDFDSRNGVFVNRQLVEQKKLAKGDLITIGNFTLVYEPNFIMRMTHNAQNGLILMPDSKESAEPHEKNLTEQIQLPAQETPSGELLTPEMVALKQLQTAHRHLQAVYKATSIAVSTLDESALCTQLVDLVIEEFHAERGALIFYSPEKKDFYAGTVKSGSEIPTNISISRTVLKRAVEKGMPFLSEDTLNDPHFDASRSLFLDKIRSFICTPINGKNAPIGALYIDTTDITRSFTKDDMELLKNIGNQAAIALENARLYARVHEEVAQLREKITDETRIVGESFKAKELIEKIAKIAPTDSTVLITGETGTGKELVAKSVHYQSQRSNRPFIAIDCSAIPVNLLESELFGHEKGAFTGAVKSKPGKFEIAHEGTLFLDEIGNLDASVQAKLLRAIEEKMFTRVGGVRIISSDVRIIAATNSDLQQAVKEKKFREDLFYRIAVVPVAVPSLRERIDDIPLLVEHFSLSASTRLGRKPPEFTDSAINAMKNHHWPGNIRELRNAVEYAIALASGNEITAEDLPAGVAGKREDNLLSGGIFKFDIPLTDAVKQVEKTYIEQALHKTKGVKSEVARILGVSRPTLDKKLKEYGLE